MEKRKLIQEYFDAPKPKLQILPIIIGIVLIFIGFNNHWLFIAIGVLIGLIAFYNYYTAKKRYEARPSDEQIDAWFNESLKKIVSKGLDKLGFDENEIAGDEIIISGPILWNVNGVPKNEIKWILGNDGITRFSVYNISVFYIAKKGFGIYSSIFNFIRDVTVNDQTDEYFYKNITRVGTREKSSNYTLPDGKKLVKSEIFTLDVAGNSEIEILLNDPELEKFTGGRIDTSKTYKSIQVIKKLVRENN